MKAIIKEYRFENIPVNDEIWVTVEGTENYEVSNFGNIRYSTKEGKLKIPKIDKNCCVCIPANANYYQGCMESIKSQYPGAEYSWHSPLLPASQLGVEESSQEYYEDEDEIDEIRKDLPIWDYYVNEVRIGSMGTYYKLPLDYIVAATFMKTNRECKYVVHLNGLSHDNRLINLQFCDRGYKQYWSSAKREGSFRYKVKQLLPFLVESDDEVDITCAVLCKTGIKIPYGNKSVIIETIPFHKQYSYVKDAIESGYLDDIITAIKSQRK